MHSPYNYSFVPHTRSEDGDPVGVLRMEDDKGMDEKVLWVPHDALRSYYSTVRDISDIDSFDRERLENFFAHYKDLEKDKWVKIIGWGDCAEAKQGLMRRSNVIRPPSPPERDGTDKRPEASPGLFAFPVGSLNPRRWARTAARR